MYDDTHSATPVLSDELGSIDFAWYLACKPFLAAKDAQIVDRIATEIRRTSHATPGSLSLLDVGSGEASLIEAVSNRLVRSLPATSNPARQVQVDCVEPSPEGQVFIRGVAERLAEQKVDLALFPNTIEEFLKSSRAKYNAIICCHALYHIPEHTWVDLIHGLLDAVDSEGLLLVDLVSRTSEIYRLLDDIEPIIQRESLPRTFDSCGELRFAEDFKAVLGSIGCKWTCQAIRAPVMFPKSLVREGARSLAAGEACDSVLIQFIAFMLRLRPDDLAATAREPLGKLLTPNRGTLTFRFVDHLYILRKGNR